MQVKISLFLFYIALSAKIDEKLLVGHFTAIFGHFFANYINMFQKTEVLTVILRCLAINPSPSGFYSSDVMVQLFQEAMFFNNFIIIFTYLI